MEHHHSPAIDSAALLLHQTRQIEHRLLSKNNEEFFEKIVQNLKDIKEIQETMEMIIKEYNEKMRRLMEEEMEMIRELGQI